MKSRGITKMKTHRVFICPRARCLKKEVFCQKTSGYTNTYRHLVQCFGTMNTVFDEVRKVQCIVAREAGCTQIGDYFKMIESANEREKAINAYITLFTLCNAPLTFVEDRYHRVFCKYDVAITIKTLKEVIFTLSELVENNIADEMRMIKGAIMHYGWTNCGMHYIEVIAVYCRSRTSVRNGRVSTHSEVVSPLLSMSPMAKICRCGSMECAC